MENFILNSKFFDQSVVRLPEEEIAPSLFNGSNQKKILIVSLVEEENQSVDDDFLKKIMASVNIDLDNDTTLFALPQNKNFTWKSITKSIEFEHLIFFGNSLSKLGLQISFQYYVPFDFQEKSILVAEPLDVIAADRTKKGALWNALKGVYLKG